MIRLSHKQPDEQTRPTFTYHCGLNHKINEQTMGHMFGHFFRIGHGSIFSIFINTIKVGRDEHP